jgi:syntaxin-binding protein 1
MSKQETLRDYAKYRILDDMVRVVKRHVMGDREYLILVMDTSALKVFSSCCKLFDVYKAGLYHIERLEKKRKKYPNSNAIYLISPTKESIDRLIDDFAK